MKLAASPQMKTTAFAPVKLSPVMTTLVPTGPLVGEKLITRGVTRKILLLFSVPVGAVTGANNDQATVHLERDSLTLSPDPVPVETQYFRSVSP